MNDPTVEAFETQRHRLFGVAYRMLGSVTEAEDAVHQTRVNGDPGVVAIIDGTPSLVIAFQLGPAGIQGVRIVLNPEKLTHLRGRGWAD